MAKRRVMEFDLRYPGVGFDEVAGAALRRAAPELVFSNEVGYSLAVVEVREDEIVFEYRGREEAAGWSDGYQMRRVRFLPMEGSDDLFSERRERWVRARARFEWPDGGETVGRFRFVIERDHELAVKREFTLRGDNSKRLLEWFPQGSSVEFSIRCEVSVERALHLMAKTGDPRFAWTSPMHEKLPLLKRMVTRGKLGYAEADRAVGEAMDLLEMVAGQGPEKRRALDDRPFDFIEIALDSLQTDRLGVALRIAGIMVENNTALAEFGVGRQAWSEALERGLVDDWFGRSSA